MKNRIKYVIFSVLLITGLSSCIDDFLELETPPGQMDAEELLSDPGLINSVLNGTLKNMGESDSYRNVVDRWFDAANTDIEMWKTLTTAGNAEASIMQYNVGVNNTQYKLDKVWSSVQENIDICNNVISWFADSTNTLLQGDKKNAMRPLYAKALTLRAYYYYDLIRWWGDVQLRFDANLYAPKTDRNTIYKFIIDDLKKAEDYIGWAEEMQSNSYYEINADFPTKAAIKAFRARISLAAAGYSQYPKSDPVDREFTLVDRPVGNALRCRIARVDNTRRIELLTEARDACKEIYQRYGTSKLTADFEKIFKTSLAGGTESEVLWQLRYESEKQRYMGNKHAAGGVFGPNYTSDWGARYYVMPTFFFDFSEGDTRRDITCQPFQWASNIQQAVKINNMSFGKKRKEWLPNLATGAATFTPNIVVRYADVLLMLAEAENELNGPTGEAQEAFMAVRNRAFGGNAALASAGLDLSSQESFFNAIVNERAFEFAGEQIRRADLIRWGLLKTKIDDTKEKLQLLKGSDAVRQTPYDWVPTDVYTRKSTKPASAFLSDFFAGTAITALDFYGFNRGENAASADEVPGGAYDADTNPTGWTKVTSTVWGAGNSTIASSWYDCLYINGTNAPDEMQLLPVTPNIRALTNETMKDDYGYYTTGL